MVNSNDSTTIGLRVTGWSSGPIASDFLKASGCFLKLISEIDITISSDRTKTVRWIIKDLSKKSPLSLVVQPEIIRDEDNRQNILNSTMLGLESLQESDNRPPFFSDRALEIALELSNMMNSHFHLVEIVSGSQSVVCNGHIATSIQSILKPQKELLGTIEGRLEAMNSHEGFRFHIYEPVFGNRILCEIGKDYVEGLKPIIVKLYEKRVRASGTLQANRRGEIKSAKIEEIQALRNEPAFSGPEDIVGIYDITSGVDAEKYIRKMRDA